MNDGLKCMIDIYSFISDFKKPSTTLKNKDSIDNALIISVLPVESFRKFNKN